MWSEGNKFALVEQAETWKEVARKHQRGHQVQVAGWLGIGELPIENSHNSVEAKTYAITQRLNNHQKESTVMKPERRTELAART